jgi:hypothetical protein
VKEDRMKLLSWRGRGLERDGMTSAFANDDP